MSCTCGHQVVDDLDNLWPLEGDSAPRGVNSSMSAGEWRDNSERVCECEPHSVRECVSVNLTV